MLTLKTAGARLHAQEGDGLCGAAVGLTVLSDGDVGGNIEQMFEKDLYDTGHQHSDPQWFIDPGGLQLMLRRHKPAQFREEFVIKGLTSEAMGTGEIIEGLSRNKALPPAVLVHEGRHWISINGVEIDGEATSGEGCVLHRLWVHDPYTANSIERSHSASDDCIFKGISDQCIYYPDAWVKRFTPAIIGDKEVFIVIKTDGGEAKEPRKLPLPDPILPTLPRDEHGLISEEAVGPLWKRWQEVFGPWPSGSVAEARLTGSEVGKSVQVHWLDRDDVFRLAVLKLGSDIVGSFALDARTAIPDSVIVVLPGSPAQESMGRLDSGILGDKFVWRPCLESFSLHLPFRTLEDGLERIDGKRFSKFTSEIKGA
jgi:hypothetical protein